MEPISLGFQTDIALLRLGGSIVEEYSDHLVVRTPHNPTHWWGNFVLLGEVPPPERSQQWLDHFSDAFPAADHVAMGFDGTDRAVEDLSWFASRGYDAEAAAVMTATEIHEPSTLNREARYRQLRSDEDWMQSVDLRTRCNERPLGDVAYRMHLMAKATTNRQIVEAGCGAWFGAFLDDRLVAQMGLVKATAGVARFQTVETDPAWRRRGLAGSLIHRAATYGLTDLGAHTLVIVADPSYFALDLYRSVGFVVAETQLQIERPPSR